MASILKSPPEDVERAMAPIFEAVVGQGCAPDSRFKDSDFVRISELLAQLGTPGWSERPRTYAILRVIGSIKSMKSFIDAEFLDISIPYDSGKMAKVLAKSLANKFIEKQYLVMTDAYDLEKADGQHQHLDHDADTYFLCGDLLGSGGFGEVDLVRSKLSLKNYARKRVLRSKTQGIKSIARELSSLKRLSHHHLVKLLGSYTDPRYIGCIMEPVAEWNLQEYLNQSPFPSSQKQCLRGFYGSLASAITYLHLEKIRHKDLKPSNLLVKDSKVLITDFGAALDWSRTDRSTTKERIGEHTPAYMAPEVEDWQPRNSSTDIYSLGLIFMEMTTVLKGETLQARLNYFLRNGNKTPLHRTNLVASESWQKMLEKKSPDDNQPLKWCRIMTPLAPESRIKADILWKTIYNWQDKYRYYPLCCDESETISEERHSRAVQSTVAGGRRQSEHEKSKTKFNPSAGIQPGTDASPTIPPKHTKNEDEIRLFDAARKGNLVMVKLLHQQGVNIEAKDDEGRTAMIIAAENANNSVMNYLLDSGADIDAQDNDGRTALHKAASGPVFVFKSLLQRNPDLEMQTHEGSCALHFAVKSGDEEITRLLLKAGADINRETFEGWTALLYSAKEGYESIARLLLDAPELLPGQAPDAANLESTVSKGMTCLHKAANFGHTTLVELFLERGLEVERKTDLGWTAFHFAAHTNEVGVALLLLQNDADMLATTNRGYLPLHLACLSGSMDMVSLLLDYSVNIDALDEEMLTPLHFAALYGKPKVLEMLIERGAKLMARTCYEYTPLHFTVPDSGDDDEVKRGKIECAKFLLQQSVDIDAGDQHGLSPLHKAAASGSLDFMRFLLDHGANVNVEATDTYRPLDSAILNSQEAAVALLLQRGANVHNANGRAMNLAVTNGGQMSIVRLLVNYGATMEGHEELLEFLNLDEGMANLPGPGPGPADPSEADLAAINRLLSEDEEYSNFTTVNYDTPSSFTPQRRSTGIEPAAKVAPEDSPEEDETDETDENKTVAIKRLQDDGFDTTLAAEAYSLCGNNEEEARFVLLEMYEALAKGATRYPPGSLHEAVSKKDMAVLKMVLAMGCNINEISKSCHPDQTALMCAAAIDANKFLQTLLNSGADVAIKNSAGNTALHFATEAGNVEAAKILLEHGADIEAKNKHGWTPLGCATPAMQKFLADWSKEKEALKSPQNITSQPIASSSNPKTVDTTTLKTDGSVRKKPPPVPRKNSKLAKRFGATPLAAASEEPPQVAMVDNSERTISTFQSSINPNLMISITRLPTSQKQPPPTPIETKVPIQTKEAQPTPRSHVLPKPTETKETQPSSRSPILPKPPLPVADKKAVAHKAPPAKKPQKGKLPFPNILEAVSHGSLLDVIAQIKHGSPINDEDDQGNTALHLASSLGSDAKVIILLNHGAPANTTNKIGNTSLHKAAQMGRSAVCKMLLEKDADVGAKNQEGETPLHVAAFYGQVDAVKLLLSFMADVKVKDKKGNDVLRAAEEGDRMEIGEGRAYQEILGLLSASE
ncbi:hypothetical protein G7Y89_g10507 [Cudoniella acicularis]|uniref:Uncharacterized protein n=1 Tax=Cudoniella acicularis TaxID=354080 RepID=A0A8H4RE65_9HELO|nr:hypothetical protein G7Y89_g10507 [Cudoniella acicularis]